jgi:hypothetical protein
MKAVTSSANFDAQQKNLFSASLHFDSENEISGSHNTQGILLFAEDSRQTDAHTRPVHNV